MNLPIIKNTIIILLIILGIYNKPTPARLAKKEPWSKRNYGLIMTVLFTILIILLMGLFITFCFAIGGTESGKWYNGQLA